MNDTNCCQSQPDAEKPIPAPWRSIWLHPRQTLQQRSKHRADCGSVLPVICAGIATELSYLHSQMEIGRWPEGIVWAIGVGVITAVVGFHLLSYLLKLGGMIIGGRATAAQLRMAIGWGCVPMAWLLPLILIAILFFASTLPIAVGPRASGVVLLLLGLCQMVLPVWAAVLSVIGISQVQGFGIARAIMNVLLAILLAAVAVSVVVIAADLITIARLSQ